MKFFTIEQAITSNAFIWAVVAHRLPPRSTVTTSGVEGVVKRGIDMLLGSPIKIPACHSLRHGEAVDNYLVPGCAGLAVLIGARIEKATVLAFRVDGWARGGKEVFAPALNDGNLCGITCTVRFWRKGSIARVALFPIWRRGAPRFVW